MFSSTSSYSIWNFGPLLAALYEHSKNFPNCRSSRPSKADTARCHRTGGLTPRRSRSWTATAATRRSTTTSSTGTQSTGDPKLDDAYWPVKNEDKTRPRSFNLRPEDYADDNYSQPYRSQEEAIHTSYRWHKLNRISKKDNSQEWPWQLCSQTEASS